ncbi:MAG: hypothetical protein ACLFPL_02230 [Candidatus Nanoarchaeia archaeon]
MIKNTSAQTVFHSLFVYIILFFFIILNVLDFLDLFPIITFLFPGDTDFFKKLISWGIIIYLFSNISLTSLLTGFKSKIYDLLILLGSSFIVLPSLLIFYINSIDFNNYSIFSFIINTEFLQLLQANSQVFNVLGIIIILLVSGLIFVKLPITQDSFIGSVLNNKESYFSELFKLFLIIFFILFFAFTYFKFFMEWFALAVDAILLVIGMLYYIYIYVFKHEKELKLNSFLRDIVNTGNNFFKELLIYLKDKNTILISIALLLSAHLLVDVGVYIIPFATGIDNSLYDVLDNDETQIKPLFGASNSWLSHQYQELSTNPNFQEIGLNLDTLILYLILFLEIMLYCINILVFSILLIMPFILIYFYLKKDVFIPSKLNIILILSMVTLQLFLLSSPILNNAIQFSILNSQDTQGIVFITQGLFENLGSVSVSEILYTIFSFFVAAGFIVAMLYLKYEKYRQFWVSIYYIVILVFFLLYSTIFAQSYITSQYSNYFSSSDSLNFDEQLYKHSDDYKLYSRLISSNNSVESISLRNLTVKESRVESDLYITSYIEDVNFDIIGIQINTQEDFASTFNLKSSQHNNVITSVYNYSYLLNQSEIEEIFIILTIPQNKTTEFVDLNQRIMNSQNLDFLSSKSSNEFSIGRVSSLLITTIISIFYIAGLIGYALLYRYMLNELKRKIF